MLPSEFSLIVCRKAGGSNISESLSRNEPAVGGVPVPTRISEIIAIRDSHFRQVAVLIYSRETCSTVQAVENESVPNVPEVPIVRDVYATRRPS